MPVLARNSAHFNIPPDTGPPYVAGVHLDATTGGYFTDQNGDPILYVADWAQGVFTNLGRWSSGDWQGDIDTYLTTRAAQGLTVHHDTVINCVDGYANLATGGTWDGLVPFTSGGDPASGLDATFWARADYMIASARARGITIAWAIGLSYNWPSGRPYAGWSTAQFAAFGAAIGARYPSSTSPNIIWLFGDDNNSGDASMEADWDTMLTAMRAAGANQPVSVYWEAESTSRFSPSRADLANTWGVTNSDFDSVYAYQAAYWMPEYAYRAVELGASRLLPVIWSDGQWYNGSGADYYAPTDRQYRQSWWWVLTSGSRGFLSEATNVYNAAGSGWLAAAAQDWVFIHNQGNIVTWLTALPGWQDLVPDLASALVTAGRGTHASFTTTQYSGFGNSYVSASKTPDGTAAVLYLPNAATVTIDTAQLAAGATAAWVDPVSCAEHATTVRASYNSGATDGSKGITNSQGDPDWVLAFRT